MEHKTFTTHQIATCSCGWRNEDFYKSHARKNAYNHAQRTGHRVTVETGLITKYN